MHTALSAASIGLRLMGRRLLIGHTVETVAERAGLPTNTLDDYESGNRVLRTTELEALCGVLGITIAELLLSSKEQFWAEVETIADVFRQLEGR